MCRLSGSRLSLVRQCLFCPKELPTTIHTALMPKSASELQLKHKPQGLRLAPNGPAPLSPRIGPAEWDSP